MLAKTEGVTPGILTSYTGRVTAYTTCVTGRGEDSKEHRQECLSRKPQKKRSTVLQAQSLRWFRRKKQGRERDKTVRTESIRKGELPIEYTPKPLSGWGGLSLMFEYLEQIGFYDQLREAVEGAKGANRGRGFRTDLSVCVTRRV